MKRSIAIGLAALMLSAGAACGSSSEGPDGAAPQDARASGAPAESGAQVVVQMFRYQPEELTVAPGTEVKWTNRDEILHTATSGVPDQPTDVFDGEMATQGETFSFAFDREGSYPYFCSRHNGMRGTIVVAG